jgi:uncharacterized protein involved in exopolysaccharide biosynthesis/Mrp family chromosome partitioning ATPase
LRSIRLSRPAWVTTASERFEPLGILVRHAKLFAVVFISVLGLTALAYFATPVRYVATGTVLVGDPEPALAQTPGEALKAGDPADMESQLVIARSQRVMRRALSSDKAQAALQAECLAENGEGFGGDCERLFNRMDRLFDYTSTRFAIGAVGRSRVIDISYTSSEPQVAADMANALITAYLEVQRETVAEGQESAASWLRAEASSLNDEIRALDKQIADYRAENGLVRGASGPVGSERLTAISGQLAAAEAAQATASARLAEIRDVALGGSANSTAVLESRTIGDLKQRIIEAEAQLANAETSLGPAHPRLRARVDELRNLNSRLASEIERVTQNAQKQYEAATERVTLLSQQLNNAKTEVSTATGGEVFIEDTVRNAEIKRQQYADLAGRINQLEVERRVRSGNVRLVSEARVPTKPFFPKKVPFAAAGLTLALLLAAVAAFLADKLSPAPVPVTRSKETGSEADASLAPAAPFVEQPAENQAPRRALKFTAILPYLDAADDLDPSPASARLVADGLIRDPDARDALDEFSWIFGSAARSGDGPRAAQVVLVTSPSVGSGKTITTAAVAHHLAASGEKVLVIDCNLKRPLISEMLAPSLPHNHHLPQDPIVRTPVQGLDVVPAGYAKLVLPKSEGSARDLEGLLGWARKDYGLILLDGPAATSADIFRLADHAEVVVVCATQDELDTDATRPLIADILASREVEIGVVVTMINFGRDRKPVLQPATDARLG